MDLVCPGTMFDLQCCTGARYFAKCGSDVSTANSSLRDLQAIERSRVLQNVPDTPRQIGGDMTELKSITIRGAREHNLKNVDLDLPRDSLIVMTGLSGRASHRSPSTPSMPKASAAMSKACRPMRGSFWR
jgi:hypothetical protein